MMLAKKVLSVALTLLMMLSITGCTGDAGAEPASAESGVTQEEYDALQEQMEQLQQELDELKQQVSSQSESEAVPEEEENSSSSSATAEASSSSVAGESSSSQSEPSQAAAASETSQPQPAQSQPQPQQPASSASSQPSQQTGNGPLAKYTVNVLDPDTPAVSVTGKAYNGGSAYVFTDGSGNVVGTIPAEILGTIIRENGLSYAEAEEQKAWFIENFNLYRGLETEEMDIPVLSVPEYDAEEFAQEVIRLTNVEREKAGLEPLVEHETAMEYAQIRAEEIADYFSHDRLNGEDGGMYSHYTFMENIAKGSRTPEAVVEGWMNSPGHKATMMADYSDYGNGMGVGVYRKNGVIYWVQEFLAWDANG